MSYFPATCVPRSYSAFWPVVLNMRTCNKRGSPQHGGGWITLGRQEIFISLKLGVAPSSFLPFFMGGACFRWVSGASEYLAGIAGCGRAWCVKTRKRQLVTLTQEAVAGPRGCGGERMLLPGALLSLRPLYKWSLHRLATQGLLECSGTLPS